MPKKFINIFDDESHRQQRPPFLSIQGGLFLLKRIITSTHLRHLLKYPVFLELTGWLRNANGCPKFENQATDMIKVCQKLTEMIVPSLSMVFKVNGPLNQFLTLLTNTRQLLFNPSLATYFSSPLYT